MYKILIKIMVLMAALVLFSTHAGAASLSLSTNLPGQEDAEITPFFSAHVSPGDLTPIYLSSPITSSPSNLASNRTATQALGSLDRITWEKLDQPHFGNIFSQLLIPLVNNEYWPPDFITGNNPRAVSDAQNAVTMPPQAADTSYAHFVYSKAFGELDKSCDTCQLPSGSKSASFSIYSVGQVSQLADYRQPIIDCARCHMQKTTQVSWQLRGAE